MSPELLFGSKYSKGADVWAVGIMILEFLTLK